MKDWPRIAKLQSDLLVQALAMRQTRVASYMLTKCQSLTRFPWLGYTSARHHDYTHAGEKTSGADGTDGTHVLRDIAVGMSKSLPILLRSSSQCRKATERCLITPA